MASGTSGILGQLEICPKQTVGLSERRAKIFRLLESVPDLTEIEAPLYAKFLLSLKKGEKKIDPNGLSTRMLRECFQRMADLTILKSSLKWTDSGMTVNGKISTLPGTSPKTGSAYTLSDILEPEVDSKYFLSQSQVEKILLD